MTGQSRLVLTHPKLAPKHPGGVPKLGPKHPQDIPKLPPTHPGGTPKVPLRSGSRSTGTQPREYSIARIVVDGPPPRDAVPAEGLLHAALDGYWPEDVRSRFLSTPGGFIVSDWPASWNGNTGWGSRPRDIEPLVAAAEKTLWKVLTHRVLDLAARRTRILSVSVDLFAGSTLAEPHAELVFLVDVTRRKLVGWTGKSYPLAAQERGLVQVSALRSHLFEVAGERVLVLGCHDLNMFSARAYANQAPGTERRMRTDNMLDLAREFEPTLVLQHPHLTDSPRIWSTAWGSLQKGFPTVRAWASSICYYRWGGEERAALDAVLDGTRSTHADVLDIIVPTHT